MFRLGAGRAPAIGAAVAVLSLSPAVTGVSAAAPGAAHPVKRARCGPGKQAKRVHGRTRCVRKSKRTATPHRQPSAPPARQEPASQAPAAPAVTATPQSNPPDFKAAYDGGAVSGGPVGPVVIGGNGDGTFRQGCATLNDTPVFLYYGGWEATGWYNACTGYYGWSSPFYSETDHARFGNVQNTDPFRPWIRGS
jgi:hypothetical protein